MKQKLQKFLQKLEDSPEGQKVGSKFASGPFWNVPHTTAVFLNAMVGLTKAKKVLEIGTSNGYSGIWFAEALEKTGGKLFTVESHKERFELAQQNFQDSVLAHRVEQIFGHAPEIFPVIGNDFDLVFLDATKIEYKSYIENLIPKIKKGGLVIADNVISHGEEMQDFIELVQHQKGLQSFLLPFDNGLMLSLKL